MAPSLPSPLRSTHPIPTIPSSSLAADPPQQILSSHVQRIAKLYNSSAYQIAADHFRIPYWDYASSPSIPDIVNAPQALIQISSGSKNVSNPLLLYRFQQFPLNETLFPAGQSGEGCLTTYNTTVRFPVNGVPNCESINADLGSSNLEANTVCLSYTPFEEPIF